MNDGKSILTGLNELGESFDQIKAGIIIGSRARSERPADEYSDIDIVLLVEEIEFFVQSDEWLNSIGKYHISFCEDTIAGGKERRAFFDNALDVDFIFLPANDIASIENDRNFRDIVAKSYKVLFDKIGFAGVLRRIVLSPEPYSPLLESDFKNLVSNFWFHSIWAAKKVLRGELWIAESCLDGYMKNLLLRMIEHLSHAIHGPSYNTWHSGRFIENWAESWIVEKLPAIFAGYSAADIFRALTETMDLFRQVAMETAERMGYTYPREADAYAAAFLQSFKRSG